MPRLDAVNPETATGEAKTLLDGVQKNLGATPNLMRTMALSPAVLNGYLSFSGALGKGRLSQRLREQIALAVAEANGCDYCLSAHSAVGKMAGLSEEEIERNRSGESSDPRTEAALVFARKLVQERGWVQDDDLETVRSAGFDEGETAEIVANVALNLFTNYFNHVAETEVDFPRVSARTAGSGV
jgi:uncharacterized peroxidase-related enzyme